MAAAPHPQVGLLAFGRLDGVVSEKLGQTFKRRGAAMEAIFVPVIIFAILSTIAIMGARAIEHARTERIVAKRLEMM